MFLLSLCDKSYWVEILLIIKIFLQLVCYIVPLIIIIVSIINLFKTIQSGKQDDMKDSLKLFTRRIIAGLLITIIPTLFSYVFSELVDGSGIEIIACMQSATAEKVASLKEAEEAETAAESEAEAKEAEELEKEAYEEAHKNDATKKENFDNANNERKQSDSNSDSDTTNSSSTGTTASLSNCTGSLGYCAVAHRGYSTGNKPNSVSAFEAAGKAGFWGSECDLRMRSDGTLVCAHDASEKNSSSQATFQQYIEICKKYNMTAVVDIKADGGKTMIEKAVSVVNQEGMMSGTAWQCSMTAYLKYVKEYASDARIWYLVSSVDSSKISTASSFGAELINADCTKINVSVVNSVHNANIKLGAYTVTSTALKEKLLGYGVDFIMSNKPL